MGLNCRYAAKPAQSLYRVTLIRLDGHKVVMDCSSWELHSGHIVLFMENGDVKDFSLEHYRLSGGVEGSIKKIR